jgi:hypothetical protein
MQKTLLSLIFVVPLTGLVTLAPSSQNTNIAAIVWWEEVIAYFCEPPISNLFVGETRFNGKGFECIEYIDRHFHPSGAMDLLGYIFDLINIKQKDDKPVQSTFLPGLLFPKTGGHLHSFSFKGRFHASCPFGPLSRGGSGVSP